MVPPSAANKPGPSGRHDHGFSGHVRGHRAIAALHQRSQHCTHRGHRDSRERINKRYDHGECLY